MKLEFLLSGSGDCPLIRLYHFTPADMLRLKRAVIALSHGGEQSIAVHELPGVVSIDGCQLTLRSGRRDEGIIQTSGAKSFECVLTPSGWDDVSMLLEPFTSEARGFQWLDRAGDVRLLISTDGCW